MRCLTAVQLHERESHPTKLDVMFCLIHRCNLGQERSSREARGEKWICSLFLNATAAGLENEVPPVPDRAVDGRSWCYDLVYADVATAFVRWAREHGALKAVYGFGMLVEQAAESFFIWRSVRPDTAPVIAALRPSQAPR